MLLLLAVLGKNHYYYCSNLGVGKKTLKRLKINICLLLFLLIVLLVSSSSRFHLPVNTIARNPIQYVKAGSEVGFLFLLGQESKQPQYQNVYICFQAGMYFLFLNDMCYILFISILNRIYYLHLKTKPTLLLSMLGLSGTFCEGQGFVCITGMIGLFFYRAQGPYFLCFDSSFPDRVNPWVRLFAQVSISNVVCHV